MTAKASSANNVYARFFINFKSNLIVMRYAACLIILFLLTEKNYGQSFPNIQFAHLTDKEGLSNNQVNSILQDNDGFIWIGTSDGLNRFDGYRVRSFYQTPGVKNSLVYNGISNLACDHKNGLWISTSEGISYYNKQTGQFYNFRHNPADSTSIANDEYVSVYLPDDSTAWITNSSLLYRFNSKLEYKKVETGFKIIHDQKEFLSYGNLIEDRQHQLWGYTPTSLFLVDKISMRPKNSFENYQGIIKTIYQDSHLKYWIGSFAGGLTYFDPVKGTFQNIPLVNKSMVVNCVTEWKDKQGFNWLVAGTDAGLVLIDPVSLRSKAYQYQPGSLEQYSLSGNNVSSVVVDRQNILWIGTDNGVSYVRPSQQQFELWRINSAGNLRQTVSADHVYSCDENKQGLWFSTWLNYGIYLYCPGNEYPTLVTVGTKNSSKQKLLDSLKPYYVLCRGDTAVWFTTENSLVELNLITASLHSYDAPGTAFPIGLRTIVPVSPSKWWIRTRNNGANGLYLFDPTIKKFTRHFEFDKMKEGSAPALIMSICRIHHNEIFLGTSNGGLYKYDSSADRFIHLFQFTDQGSHAHSNEFECVTEDKKGMLWIGTYKGLVAFDPVSKKIVHDYSEDSLIGGVEISALAFDAPGNLWMNSERGMVCLTKSGLIKHFTRADGLPNNFDEGALMLAKDGYMYSGFRNVLVRFKPENLLKVSSPITGAHFSDATVMDKPYFFHYGSSGEKEMTVEAGQNRFSLDFSLMNFDNNNEKQYYYRLDGAMNDWQQNENGHLVFYNIAPGTYTLHVTGADVQSPSLAEEDIVHIKVNAFWW